LRACRTALDARADLRHYGTVQAVDDLAEVLTWLGYRQVNLYGMSYGTKAAQIFLQRHPARVRSVTLHGAMALDAPMWLDLARAAQQSFEGVAKACAVDARCGAAYGDLRAKLQAVVTKLASSPVEAQGETESGLVPVRIDDRAIRDLLNVMLTSSRGIRDVPFMVHDMAEGRFAMPASIIAQESGAAPPLIPKGLFLTLLCGESMPQVDRAAIDGATAGTLVGDFPLRYQLAECGVWPTGATQASLYQPVRSDAPALLLTGELDNTTPPAYAERVAAGLPRGRVLRLPARSHNDVDACVTGLIAAFIAGGDAAAVDTSCVAATPPLVFRLPAAR
jgi:pimeloyl-ACP methyl ester carboxylesterase